MKLRNEKAQERIIKHKSVAGVTIITDGKVYKEFRVARETFPIKNGNILEAFKRAERAAKSAAKNPLRKGTVVSGVQGKGTVRVGKSLALRKSKTGSKKK